ncbi:MAG: extracellular solute-binding protein [Acidimicrobiales bacterium]|nr:extracellular solute-binding protein [Acidimicrobiales bacterium]
MSSTRSLWLRLLPIVGASAVLAAACGSPPTTGDGGGGREGASDGGGVSAEDCPVAALDEADGPVEVELWFGGLVEPASTTLLDLVDAFNESQDQVVVRADNQGVAYAEVLRKYNGAASTPAQLPDAIYLEDTALGEMVDKGQVLPSQACMLADDYDLDQITASARASYEVDGVYYPGYTNVSSPILYFNKAHFQKADIDPSAAPLTIAELEETARKLKAAGVSDKPLSFLTNEWFFNTWLAGAGVDTVDNDNGRDAPPTAATFDTPEAVEILETLQRMNDEGLLNVFPVTDGSIDHYLAVISEESSMLIETSTASGTIAAALGGELSSETTGQAGIDLDAAAIGGANLVPGSAEVPGLDAPGQVYASGGAFYMLNTGADAEQAGAWEFMKFMLQPENAKRWHLQGGYIPVVKEAINDPEVLDFQRNELDGVLLKPSVDQLGAADPDRTGPLIGPYTDVQEVMRSMLESVLLSGADPAEALASAQAEATEILENYNE